MARQRHRPLVDDEVTQRLRTPFEADPFDAVERQRVVAFDEDDYHS